MTNALFCFIENYKLYLHRLNEKRYSHEKNFNINHSALGIAMPIFLRKN